MIVTGTKSQVAYSVMDTDKEHTCTINPNILRDVKFMRKIVVYSKSYSLNLPKYSFNDFSRGL